MICPGCGNEMSEIKKDKKSGYECYSCGVYSATFNKVKMR